MAGGAGAEAEDVEAGLARAERTGLRLALWGRTAAVLLFAAWGATVPYPSNLLLIAGALAFLLPGLWHLHKLRRGTERRWHRLIFLTLDLVALSAAIALVPPSLDGKVPQIAAYQTLGVHYIFPYMAIAALALSPFLVLWTAAVGALGWLAGWAWAVAALDSVTDWTDLPARPSSAEYLAVIRAENFIGTGSRLMEVFFVLVTAAILALAVKRARRVVRDRAALDRERANALAVFGQYVPAEIATRLLRDPTALAPQTRDATVMFVDIAGFTHLAERLPPAEVIGLLNRYFDRATGLVAEAGGVVVGFAGDGFLAAFNTPRPLDAHAACALRAAEDLLRAVAAESFGGVPVRVRIGVATGPVAAGIVGGTARQTFTVYGDTVNLAQRLEAMCKEHGTALLVAEASWQAAGRPAGLAELGTVPVRGRDGRVRAFMPAAQALSRSQPPAAGYDGIRQDG